MVTTNPYAGFTIPSNFAGTPTPTGNTYGPEESRWRQEQVLRGSRGESVDPIWVKEQLEKRRLGQPTDDQVFASMMSPLAPTAAPTGGVGTPGAAQIGPFSDALFGDDVKHEGWQGGEAGPPGSPEFVRHPQNQADWQKRYAWFHGATDPESGTHGDMSMLDPRWTPVNMYFNMNNAEALSTLKQVASGQLKNYGITETGTPWTPEQAKAQLQAWGKWSVPGTPGGARPTTPAQPASSGVTYPMTTTVTNPPGSAATGYAAGTHRPVGVTASTPTPAPANRASQGPQNPFEWIGQTVGDLMGGGMLGGRATTGAGYGPGDYVGQKRLIDGKPYSWNGSRWVAY